MEFHGLFVDKHLYVNFPFQDAVESLCHCWLCCHTVQEFFLPGLIIFDFDVVRLRSCCALGGEMIRFATRPTHTAPSCTVGSAFSLFSSTENTCLISQKHLSSSGFRFACCRPVRFLLTLSPLVVSTLWTSSVVVWSIFFNYVFGTCLSLLAISIHFCSVNLPWRNKRLRVPPSHWLRTIRSRIRVSCEHVQKLHDCASVRNVCIIRFIFFLVAAVENLAFISLIGVSNRKIVKFLEYFRQLAASLLHPSQSYCISSPHRVLWSRGIVPLCTILAAFPAVL